MGQGGLMKSGTIASFVLLIFLTCDASKLIPQEPPKDLALEQDADRSQVTFRAISDLVLLPVNVTDRNGEFVSGLESSDFRVYEDGRLQTIAVFVREDVPVTVGLIVDHSR